MVDEDPDFGRGICITVNPVDSLKEKKVRCPLNVQIDFSYYCIVWSMRSITKPRRLIYQLRSYQLRFGSLLYYHLIDYARYIFEEGSLATKDE